MKMKIVCVGHAAYDITLPLEHFVVENTKNRVDSRIECGGGPASNAAYLLGKWGLEPYFLGVVGNDEYGQKIKEELEEVGVHTDYLEMNASYRTTSSFILANKSNGSRTILTYRPSEMKMSSITLPFSPDIILMDGQEVEMSQELLKQYPKAISIIDAGRPTEEIIALAKQVSYVVCSKEFAETVTKRKFNKANLNSYFEVYQGMKQLFPGTIVITLESEGCLYESQGKVKVMPSISVTAIDSTGAGDIFHGAFTYGIAEKLKLEDVLKLSNVTAGLSVTRIGGRNSIFDLKELKELYHEFI